MKIIGLMTSASSGKMGGIVAAHGRGSQVLRRHGVPIQKNSAAQRQNRNTFQSLSSKFKSLSRQQVEAWNTLAATVALKGNLGSTYHPTGLQLFISCNKNLMEIGASSVMVSAPSIPSNPGFHTINASPSFAGGVLTGFGLSCTPNMPHNFAVVAKATSAVSSGRCFVGKSQLKLIWAANPAPAQPIELLSHYRTIFGTVPALGTVSITLHLVDPISGFAGADVMVAIPIAASVTPSFVTEKMNTVHFADVSGITYEDQGSVIAEP